MQGMHLAGDLDRASAAIHLLSLKARLRGRGGGGRRTLVGKDIVASSEMFATSHVFAGARGDRRDRDAHRVRGRRGGGGAAVMLLTLVTGLVGKDVKPAQAKMLEASEGTAAVTRET